MHLDPESPEQPQTLVSRDSGFWPVGYDVKSGRILLYERISLSEGGYKNALRMFNTKTYLIEKTTEIPDQLDQSDTSSPDYVAMHINGELWLYNWNRKKIENRGKIGFLVGWRSNVQGFIVLQWGYPFDTIQVIKP